MNKHAGSTPEDQEREDQVREDQVREDQVREDRGNKRAAATPPERMAGLASAAPDIPGGLAAGTLSAPDDGSRLVLPRENLLTALLGIAVVLAVMNTGMFNLALPDVIHRFGISASTASWVVTGYSIVFAIFSITYSRLSDFVPIRRLLLIGLTMLGLAAVAGVFSQSFLYLLIVRLVQAAGSGAIVSLSLLLFTRYIPSERRGRAISSIMSAVSLSLGLGPVVGGAVTQYLGWNYLFAVTALVLLLVPALGPLIPKEQPVRGSFDAPGALLLAAGTTGLLLFLTGGSVWALALGIAGLTLFTIRIHLARNPFVLPALFANRRYLTLALAGVASYLCCFATLFLLPQVLLHRFGMSASHAGLVIFPGSLLAMFVSRKVGSLIDLRGSGAILRFAPLLMLLSMLLFALFAVHSWVGVLFIFMIMTFAFTSLSSGVSNEISLLLPEEQTGSGMGLFQLAQFIGGAFSIAISSRALEWQRDLPLASAYANVFWGMAGLAVLAVFASMLYRRGAALSAAPLAVARTASAAPQTSKCPEA